MTSVTEIFRHGPVTWEVTATVDGGQLLEATSSGLVQPAASGSTTVVGVARTPAVPAGVDNTSQTGYGATVTDASQPTPHVAVAYTGVYRVTASANVAPGESVTSTGSGQVGPASGSTAANAIVGKCMDEKGITAGNRGLVLVQV